MKTIPVIIIIRPLKIENNSKTRHQKRNPEQATLVLKISVNLKIILLIVIVIITRENDKKG